MNQKTPNRTLAKASLMALPLLLAAPAASAAISMIQNGAINSTTNASQYLRVTPDTSTSTSGTVVNVETPNLTLAEGTYTLSIDANFSAKPQNGLGLRFDAFSGDDDSNIWDNLGSFSSVSTGAWNTYTVDFTVSTVDPTGRIEFRLANSNAQGNQSEFLVDNYVITPQGGGAAVFSEDFEGEMVGDPANTTSVTVGSGSGQVAAVPEPSSALLLGSVAFLGLLRRRR